VTAVNDAPVANPNTASTNEDTPKSGTIMVSDIDGDVLTVVKTTDPMHGTVIVNTNGTYTYTPNLNYNGNDSFTVTVSDGKGGTAVVTVLITVTPQNDVPIAVNDSESMFEDEVLTSKLSTNDMLSGDGGNTWTLKTNPSHGTVVVNIDGTFTYTPNWNYNGTDSFTYTMTDLDGDTSVGTVTILVKGKPELTKSASKPTMNNDGTYSWKYTIVVNNDTNQQLDEVQVEDNLDNVFLPKGCTYKVTSITATGGLMSNGLFNGSSIINTLDQNQVLPANKKDSIIIEVRVDTQRQADTITVYNQALLTCKQLNQVFSLLSDAISTTSPLDATQTDIPEVSIYIPDGFSPNDDPLNQTFVITHSVTTKIDFEVFNRWGNSVYKNRDYQNDWNGKGTGNFLGKDLPNGTYYCVYKVIKLSNNEVVTSGVKYITLRR
jgi:gliding motility-associated-like protein